MTYEVIPASQLYVGPHVARLPAEQRAELQRVSGMAPRRWYRSFLNCSSYARVGLLDNVPVAMWGITGTMLSSTGTAWLSVTPEARRHPFIVGRVARDEVQAILRTKGEIQSLVLCGDDRARRFLRFLGFELGEEITENGKTFRTAVLKRTWTL